MIEHMATSLTDSSQQRPNRSFGITQLLVMTAIIAVSFACSFPSSRLPGTPNPNSVFWKLFISFPKVVMGILSLTGASLVLTRWWKHKERPEEPGRVLFLLLAAQFILTNILETIFVLLIQAFETGAGTSETIIAGITYVRMLPPFFLAAICVLGIRTGRWWWRVSFSLLAVTYLASLSVVWAAFAIATQTATITNNTFASLRITLLGVGGAATVSILICCVVDACAKTKRSNLHWFGIISFLICLILPPLSRIISARFLTAQELFGG